MIEVVQQQANKRETWLDFVKLFACILVVLGHLFQSFSKTGIIDADNSLFLGFNTAIYFFHVPVFFFCSGYLYQRFTQIHSVSDYALFNFKKILNLGVPYFVFSIATLGLKALFSSSVASPQDYGFLETLFLHPASPYWFLYTLFFLFLAVPIMRGNIQTLTIIGFSVILKLSVVLVPTVGLPFVVSGILQHCLWFVLGMACVRFSWTLNFNAVLKYGSLIFLPLAVLTYLNHWQNLLLPSCLTILGIGMTVLWGYYLAPTRILNNTFVLLLTHYTMPIFLMHTLCAAPLRSILFKFGYSDFVLHCIVGICASFFGPILFAWIAEKTVVLNFIFVPLNTIKKLRGIRENSSR